MCGIAGLYHRRDRVDPGRLASSTRALHHRGPDEQGVWADGPCAIAHTRLSIIDLAGGHQPLTARDGELVLVANGEIYNFIELRRDLEVRGHRFSSHSDSETILHAYAEWGLDLFDHLCGMYAFALYDRPRRRLVLARDRLGIKPLFVAETDEGVAFASELKALLPLGPHRPRVDPAGLVQYLQNQFATGRTTLIDGIERLLPGEAVVIEDGRVVERRRYWSATRVEPLEMDFDQTARRFDDLFEQVMSQHMRSDVSYGLFLSGGVDSSILLAMLSRLKDEPISTYSVGFPDSRLTDELPLAEKVAQRFGSRHSPFAPTPEQLLHALPDSIWAADELMRDFASLPTLLLARHAAREQKVLFSGEGGDEVFAGYGRYRPGRLEGWLKKALYPGSGGFRTRGTVRGTWPKRLFSAELYRHRQAARQPFIEAWNETPESWSDLLRRQYVDLTTALPDNLLVKADRMLMRHHAEGRVPFLDHRIVEFGLALPDRLKVADKQGKWFLKRWAERHLDRETLYGRKRGFYVPLRDWFGERELERLQRSLPAQAGIRDWFRPEGVRQLLAADRKNGKISQTGFALLQFALWHRLFIEGDGAPPGLQHPLDALED